MVDKFNGIFSSSISKINNVASIGSISGQSFSSSGGGAPSGTVFVTGTTLGDLSSGFSLEIGMGIVIGASDITVTHLGRWVVSGNSQTHTLRIRDASGTDLGSTSVNTSGATVGAFLYGILSSPVVLTAGTRYYIYSVETSGGDQWYFTNTSVTTTSVAANDITAYIQVVITAEVREPSGQ